MADTKIICGAAATGISLVQYLPYMFDTIKGRTRPHAFTWFVWGLPAGIVYLAQMVAGGGAGSWATGFTTILCTLIFLLALFYGEKQITKLDWVCFVLALLAMAWWALTNNPLGSVILVTVADLLGFGPTVRKSIHKPYEETMSSYAMGACKWVLSILALDVFSLTTSLYPFALTMGNLLFMLLLLVRRRALRRPHC